MTPFVSRFLLADGGATAIEYALIAAGIALAIIGAVTTLGQSVLNTKFNAINSSFNP